jgi:hypothetical protein|tara:strand:- start:6438 stop:7103 length:666 start_codon:yes stop_codon:yes gene_type:complete
MTDLKPVMNSIAQLHKTHGVQQKGGKFYTQVVHRMEALRSHIGTEIGIDTNIIVDDGKRVVMKATATTKDGRIIGSGFAEEIRGSGYFAQGDKRNINTTSALENAETSAIGRCLASLGLSGGEYASANEMDAVARKKEVVGVASPNATSTPQPKPKSEAQWLDEIDKINDVKDLNKFYTSNRIYFIKDPALNKKIIDYCASKKTHIEESMTHHYQEESING